MLTSAALWALAPALATPPSTSALESAERQERLALRTLATWGGSNLLVGGASSWLSEDPQWQAFHQMNAGWGAVNLVLAAGGMLAERRVEDVDTQLQRWLNYPAIFALNAGLDVGYIAAGVWLWKEGTAEQDATRVGWGHSLLLQGSALLVFDGVMARRFSKANRAIWLLPHREGVALSGRF